MLFLYFIEEGIVEGSDRLRVGGVVLSDYVIFLMEERFNLGEMECEKEVLKMRRNGEVLKLDRNRKIY